MDRLGQEALPHGGPLIRMRGEVDAADADQLRLLLRGAFAGERRVVVDLAEITYLDSSILAVLITESLDADKDARELVIAIGTNGLLRSFELKGLMQVMHLVDSVDDVHL